MNIEKLAKEPLGSIVLHEAEIIKMEINEDTSCFRLKLGSSVYSWNEEVLKDIFADPDNNKLILDLKFSGIKMDRLILSNDFVLNEDLSITNNDYNEDTHVLNIGIEDNSLHYMDLFFRYDCYEWVYVDEIRE